MSRISMMAAIALMLGAPAAAQTAPDTAVTLDALVVTADRVPTSLASSLSAVSVITAAQLAAVPNATLADVLRQVPGFALLDLHGLGYDPQVTVRGFYGGGEAEYVVLLLDGKPLNDVQSGRIAWDAIPLAAVERIEIVRGGASALWGDAAIGGVINVVTKSATGRTVDWSLAAGSHDTWRGNATARGSIAGRAASVSSGFDRTDGFRGHSSRATGRAAGTLDLLSASDGSLTASMLTHWRDYAEPGPLTGGAVAVDRAASDVFYRFDHVDDRSYRLGLDGERALSPRTRLFVSLAGDMRDIEAVRTLGLSPDFADTQERQLGTVRGVGSAQLAVQGTGLPLTDRIVFGIDASRASADSRYFGVLSGDRDVYRASTGEHGELVSSGEGRRSAAAAFAEYTLLPVEAVRISAGVRADWLRDSFSSRGQDGGEPVDARHHALSPRLGMNVQYLRTTSHTGNVYVSAGRSFKAPTLDQLFDQRRMPVPFPPWTISISNELLDPQRGESIEAGIVHRAALVTRALSGELSLAVYQMDMEDELDFSFETFSYINIGRSRHRGLEAGLRVAAAPGTAAFLNYTRQSAILRAGDHFGMQVKAIPRHALSAGLNAPPAGRLSAGAIVTHAWGTFLDDANTLTLPPYTRVDASLSWAVASMRLSIDVRNLLDAHYSTTGFRDPSGSDVVFYHPAAGRTVEVGISGSH